MRSLLGALLSVAALVWAGAANAAEPACVDPAGGQSVANTRWQGTSDWEGADPNPMTLFLRGDCVVEYVSRGVTYANGRWIQRGSLIQWQTNDHFAIYVGQGGLGQMGGVMYNRQGKRGEWRFKRAD